MKQQGLFIQPILFIYLFIIQPISGPMDAFCHPGVGKIPSHAFGVTKDGQSVLLVPAVSQVTLV